VRKEVDIDQEDVEVPDEPVDKIVAVEDQEEQLEE